MDELLGTRAQPERWSRSGSLCAEVAHFALRKIVEIRGFSKMTLSSLQAQAPRVILSAFSPSNCIDSNPLTSTRFQRTYTILKTGAALVLPANERAGKVK